MSLLEKFIVNESGNKVTVILSIEEHEAILEQLEELEDLRAFDATIDSKDDASPFD